MPRLDHLTLPVGDWQKSRDWYCRHLGFQLEREIAEAGIAAIRDDADLTIFLQRGEAAHSPMLAFTIQVDDVEEKYRSLSAAGVGFVHPPMKAFWGYGAELRDPDGYILRLWDEKSMREKG
jgi:catechol 2,3-dioxygenase-like lactoylglutathione lyase family enzyme